MHGAVPQERIALPAGSLQTLLSELIAATGAEAIGIRVDDDEEPGIHFRLEAIPAPDELHAELDQLRRSALWDFLSHRLDSLSVQHEGAGLRLILVPSAPSSQPGTFIEEAIAAFRSAEPLDVAEAEALGTILHDLKNHLVAFHVALTGSTEERTVRLRSQYEASKHLDEALALVEMARTVGRALSRARPERLDIGDFFREYFAEKYASLPSTIQLLTPTRGEGGMVWTDRAYLRSILDNIIKNAVEALPDGGRITCEWVVDHDNGRLLLEIEDDGPGITGDLLERLLAGQPVESEKPGGSGIGLLTVRSLVGRLGGTISGGAGSPGGMRWSIELPVAETVARRPAVSEPLSEEALA